MPLQTQMFCREQIFVDSLHMFELKRLEKDVLRFTNLGGGSDEIALLTFCRDWFMAILKERADKLAREEAWRREWSGKKGEIKALFDQIDADKSGAIDFDELNDALKQIPDFFGYSASGDDESGTPEGMQEWLEDEVSAGQGAGARALFERIDLDGDGLIEWEEFWTVIGEWMDNGFNRLEELRQREEERRRERERLAREAELRRLAEEEEAARLAAEEEARRAEEERRRRLAEEDAEERERRKALEKQKEEERERREKIAAEKAEEARVAADEAARLAAMDDEERKRRRLEREAAEAEARRIAAEEAEAKRLREEEEAARLAAERAQREADLERWSAAVAASVAVGEAAFAAGDPRAIELMMEEALRQLEEGEPGLGDAGCALMKSDEQRGQLVVAAAHGRAPGGVAAAMHEETFPASAGALSATAHQHLAGFAAGGGGELVVSDPEGVGVGALTESHGGRAFGVLCSGGKQGRGRVPDEFLAMMSAAVGPLADRIWRAHRLEGFVEVAKMWIETLCEGDSRLAGVEWLLGAGPEDGKGDGTPSADGSRYELGLTNAWDGAVAGTLRVTLKDGATLNESMMELMRASSTMLREIKADLDSLMMGEAFPDWIPEGLRGMKMDMSKVAFRVALVRPVPPRPPPPPPTPTHPPHSHAPPTPSQASFPRLFPFWGDLLRVASCLPLHACRSTPAAPCLLHPLPATPCLLPLACCPLPAAPCYSLLAFPACAEPSFTGRIGTLPLRLFAFPLPRSRSS